MFQVKNLDGLSRLLAIGTLVLSQNDLAWDELYKIRHMHILDLSLHGNKQLEKDPYCKCCVLSRILVIVIIVVSKVDFNRLYY